jgi:hypothetical protein
MTKQRDINELRQTKDAHYVHPLFQGGDFIKPTDKPAKSTREVMLEDADAKTKEEKMNPSKYTENDLEQAKCSIAEKITKHMNDTIFEIVCEEMGNNYLFQSDNYLTEAGYDMFEDEWFEFYHEHHGDIMNQVMQNITN